MARGLLSKLFLFLVLGALANIAIAWACSLQPLPTDESPFVTLSAESQSALWYDVAEPDWPGPSSGGGESRCLGVTIRMLWSGRAEYLIDEYAFGWPRRSMRWRYVRSPNGERFETVLPPDPVVNICEPIFRNPPPEGLRFALPLQPVWPGFIKNTVFLAIVIWFLSLMRPLGLVRWYRGRCQHCGYDLRGASGRGCPECGWGRR